MNKKKHIVFVTQLSYWNIGKNKGIRVLKETTKTYLENNWNVSFICKKWKNFDGIQPDTINFEFIKTFSIDKLYKFPLIGSLFKTLYIIIFAIEVNLKLLKLKKKNDIDILYAIGPFGIISSFLFAKLHNTFFISRHLGTWSAYSKKNNIFYKLRYWFKFLSFRIPSNAYIITDDGTKANYFFKWVKLSKPNKVLFIKNGIDKNLFNSKSYKEITNLTNSNLSFLLNQKLSKENVIFITVSRINKDKRVYEVVKAFDLFLKKKNNTNAILLVVGTGSDISRVKTIINKDNSNNIILLGALTHSEISYLMKLADVFISLYKYSNIGNPLIEALHCGKPVILSNTGDTITLFEKLSCGLIVEEDNIIEDTIDAIDKLNSDKYLRELYSNNSLLIARQTFLSWEERMKQEYEFSNRLYEIHNLDKK